MSPTSPALRAKLCLATGGLLLLAALLPPAIATAADARCEDSFVCIHEVQVGDDVHLEAENLSAFPVTYTLRVRSHGFTSLGPSRITQTLDGGETKTAVRLRPRPAEEPGRFRYYYDWTVGDRHASHDDRQLYLLPYEPGTSYRVIQGFDSRFSHTGLEQFAIDFRMAEGTPVHAARGGLVARVEERHSIGCWRDGCGRYANFVVILHDDGTTGEYYHLQQGGALVEVGDRVSPGQKIALSGNTGHTTIPHLHFAVYRAVDWGDTQSVPIRFVSADGVIDRPRRGGLYQAAEVPARLTRNNSAD